MHSGGFIIDRITDCIIEVKSGRKVETDVSRVTNADLKTVLKKNGWKFNWRRELANPAKQVYKLKTIEGDERVQCMISIIPKPQDRLIDMPLIETAPHNFGRRKQYWGVPGNLVAFACKMSFEMGFDGYLRFVPKTALIAHYQRELGAIIVGNNCMGILTPQAMILVNSYFKNFKYDNIQ